MTQTLDGLIRNLSDTDEVTRRYAAEDLGDLRDPVAVPALILALADTSTAVRESAIDALTALRSSETAAALIPLLSSEDPALRNAACEILRDIGEEAIEPLSIAAATADRDVRLFAMDVLSLIGSPGAAAVLIEALRDEDPNIAASAANALANNPSAEVIEALAATLNADPWVAFAAASSLGKIGGQLAVKSLIEALTRNDESVGFATAQALGECGGISTVVPLMNAIGQQNVLSASAALLSLERVAERLTPSELEVGRCTADFSPLLAILSCNDTTDHDQVLRVLRRFSREATPLKGSLVRKC